MIRIILVALTVILYLIFSVPVLAIAQVQSQKGPCGSPGKESQQNSGGIPLYIEAGRCYIRGTGDWRTYRQTGPFSMWGTTGATLTYWWAM